MVSGTASDRGISCIIPTIVDASAAPVVVSPGDTVYFKVKLHPYRGVDEVKTMSFTVPKNQPLGDMVLEVRGGGVIPLPYLIEKQRYNLTDEIVQRLRDDSPPSTDRQPPTDLLLPWLESVQLPLRVEAIVIEGSPQNAVTAIPILPWSAQ